MAEKVYYQRVGYVKIMDSDEQMRTYGGGGADSLDFKFNIEKPCAAQAVTATISVLGLSRETMLKLSSWYPWNMAKNLKREIHVYAGYADTGASLIFSGYIIEAHVEQPPNAWLVITADNLSWSNHKIVSSSNAEISYKLLVRQMAVKMGLVAKISDEVEDKTVKDYYNGPISGIPAYLEKLNSVRVFTDGIAKGGSVAESSDGYLYVVPWKLKNPPAQKDSLTLSSENGLIGRVDLKFTELVARIRLDTRFERAGFVWIAPQLWPEDATGAYFIHTICYRGHLRGQEWETVIKAWNHTAKAKQISGK